MPLGLEQDTTLPVELNLKEISSFVVSNTGQQDAELVITSILKAFEASADSITKELYVFDSSAAKWAGLRSISALTVTDTAEEFLQLTHSFIEQLQLRKNDARQALANSSTPGEFDETDYILSKYPLLVMVMPHFKSAFDRMENDSLDHLERIARFGGGLGVLLMVGSDVHELNQLQLITNLAGEMINSGNALLTGGRLSDHMAYAHLLESMEYNELNQMMEPAEAMLLIAGSRTQIRMATE